MARSFREDQLPQTELTSSAVRKKVDQVSIHRFRLFFHNRMPGSGYQVNGLELRTIRVHPFKGAWGLVSGPFARACNETSRDVDGLAGIGIKPRFGTENPVDTVVVEPTLKSRSLELLTVDLKIGLSHPLAGRDVR